MSKTAIVTGGAGDLGRYICRGLAADGYIVYSIDRRNMCDADRLPNIRHFVCDLCCTSELDTVNAIIEKESGCLDVIINCAGFIFSQPLFSFDLDSLSHRVEDFDSVINSNLKSTFYATKTFAKSMVLNRTPGCIINISSISASGNRGQTAYSAAKAGVNALTITWARELGVLGIRCNAIAPGFMDTPSTRKSLSESALKQIARETPLRRLGHPEDIVHTVKYLIENKFVNGEVIQVNGGLVLS